MILFLAVVFLFIIGLFVGSFLNVLADRLPRNESVLKGRSYCESCKHILGSLDLIPLVSYVFLKGRCRYCKTKLSIYYPMVEMVTGVLFALTYLFTIDNLQLTIYSQSAIVQFPLVINHLSIIINLIYTLFIVSCLIVVFFADLKYGIIPDKILLPATLVAFAWLMVNSSWFMVHGSIINPLSLILNHLLSAFGAFVFFLLIVLATRGRGMGFGDVKFAFLIGLVLGFPLTVFSLYIAFLTGAFVSVILILIGKKKLKKSTVAFGPFLVLATLVCLLWGSKISDFFLHLLQFK